MTYLVNIMTVNNGIETSVQIVQEMHHLRKDRNRSLVLVSNISTRCSEGVLRTDTWTGIMNSGFCLK